MLKKIYHARAWKFGDSVSTDSIAPGKYLPLRSKPAEYAKHVLEDANPEFPQKVSEGDFVVAGKNFGCGSSREIAPIIIKLSGVDAILAKSFGRIFYRNAINNGILLIQCNTDAIHDGDRLSIDLENYKITKDSDDNFQIRFSLSEKELKIVGEGGLLNYISKYNTLDM